MSNELARPAGGLTPRRPGTVALPGLGVPIHRGGDLSFRPGVDNDVAWAAVPLPIRDRLVERCGQVLERWAWLNRAEEACAAVLGSRALAVASPARAASGRPAHRIETVHLDPTSARVASVREDTAARPEPAGSAGLAAPIRLPDDTMAVFLGNLPARAQQMLQEPFVSSPDPLRGDHHYLRTRGAGGMGRVDLDVFCYLFDQRWLTSVSGRATTYGRSFDAARWELTCRRLAVRPR